MDFEIFSGFLPSIFSPTVVAKSSTRIIPPRLQVFVKEAEQQVEQVEAALVKVAEAAGGWDLAPLIVGDWTYEWDINEII